jgi:hypothetical protein
MVLKCLSSAASHKIAPIALGPERYLSRASEESVARLQKSVITLSGKKIADKVLTA